MEMNDSSPGRTGRPVMADVAKAAGVSLGTVSHVLNHPDRVSEKTRERVLAAIAELRFVSNSVARSLATGRLDSIGFVVVDLANSFFVEIARGAERELDRHGIHLLLANSDVDLTKQSEHLDIFEQIRASGVLLAPLDGPLDHAATMRARGLPVVHVNWPGSEDTCGVVADEEMGGFMAAQHLIEQGCRKLAFVGGPFNLTAIAQRLQGVERAVTGCPGASLNRIDTGSLTIRAGHHLGTQLLESGEPLPDGVISGADSLAAGTIQTLTNAGVRVPEQVAFVGYDNNQFAHDNVVPISSIGQPGADMGRIAAQKLIDEISNPEHTHETVVVEPILHQRESSLWKSH